MNLRNRLLERRHERDEMIAAMQERDEEVHQFFTRHPLIGARLVNRVEEKVSKRLLASGAGTDWTIDPQTFKHDQTTQIRSEIMTEMVLEAVLAVVLKKIIEAIIDYVLERFAG